MCDCPGARCPVCGWEGEIDRDEECPCLCPVCHPAEAADEKPPALDPLSVQAAQEYLEGCDYRCPVDQGAMAEWFAHHAGVVAEGVVWHHLALVIAHVRLRLAANKLVYANEQGGGERTVLVALADLTAALKPGDPTKAWDVEVWLAAFAGAAGSYMRECAQLRTEPKPEELFERVVVPALADAEDAEPQVLYDLALGIINRCALAAGGTQVEPTGSDLTGSAFAAGVGSATDNVESLKRNLMSVVLDGLRAVGAGGDHAREV